MSQIIGKSWIRLVAFLFLFHFFGSLLYAIFNSAFPLQLLGKAPSVSPIQLNLVLAGLSVPLTFITAAAEVKYKKVFIELVAKWLLILWIVLVGVIIVASHFLSASPILSK